MYKICFYVPESHLDIVKKALFEHGAGKVGKYSNCVWQVKGEGEYLPLEGSQAFAGEPGKREKVIEYKVELICKAEYIKAAIDAMKKTHPYEMPAYQVIKMENF